MSRADLHCHSAASEVSKLGVQRELGLPECATPPDEVYALAKRRGMDFVTITDHDTIAGVLEIADHPDVFVSEELTARFRGEPQAVHVLCLGITPADHEWLQAHAGDVETVAAYLHEHEIACALAHPFYAVDAPLTARHRRRLAELFPIWEVRNGSRARELNLPAAILVGAHGIGIGGSDDHAGVDIGRTWSETPQAATPEEFLAHVRAGRVGAFGDQGSAAKWAHAAMALAVRSLGRDGDDAPPDPSAVMRMIERIVTKDEAEGGDLGPRDARAVLRAWLEAVELDPDERVLLGHLQADGFSHAALERRARRCHERKLAAAVAQVSETADWNAIAAGVFEACVAAVPYAPATAFLARERRRVNGARERESARVALVADGLGSVHGVASTLQQIRERGVPGFEVEVIGTDANVDRRLSAVAEAPIPYYTGLTVGVPSLLAVVDALAGGSYDMVHVCSPGPAGVAALLTARALGLPVAGSYHTELAAYTALRSGDALLEAGMRAALSTFYGQCDVVLSPSGSADTRLHELGIDGGRVVRWDRGVDLERFKPGERRTGSEITVLYAGRLTREKGVDLLADSFLTALARDPRLRLLLAGGGPEEDALRARLGRSASFLGWLSGDDLAAAYASADIFLFCSQTDTFGQVILEAQASGLPVVAVAAGGPAELVADGRSGLLRPPHADDIASAVVALAGSPAARERLARGGLASVAGRSWEASLARLAAGWHRALAVSAQNAPVVAAPSA
jgi:glycosyltransferase involved in cell wall biosynthesis/predicted metal-dependent phosphoesterase TrpH